MCVCVCVCVCHGHKQHSPRASDMIVKCIVFVPVCVCVRVFVQTEEKRRDVFVLFRNLGKTAYNEALAFLAQALQSVIGQRAPQQQQQQQAGQAGQAAPDAAWQVRATHPFPV